MEAIYSELERKRAEPGHDKPDSEYWRMIWDFTSRNDKDAKSVRGLLLLVRNLVEPDLQYTADLSRKVQELAAKERDEQTVSPLSNGVSHNPDSSST